MRITFIAYLEQRALLADYTLKQSGIKSGEERRWNGGTAFAEPEYLNILFAKDGEIFDFNGQKAIVLGGAYSVDKF